LLEAGEEWTEDLKAAVMKQISITDYSKIVPFKKTTYEKELIGFSEGVGGRVLDGLTSMEVATGAEYHFLHTDRLVPVLRASAYANKRFFDNASLESTEWMDLKFAGVHGQVLCIQDALTLQTRDRLKDIQTAIETAIGPVVNSARSKLWLSPIVPDASSIERWGKGDLSDEEHAKFRETQLKKLEQGRETQRDIRKRANAGDKEAIEWVANQLHGLETGHKTHC
jgi:hypothetical protein